MDAIDITRKAHELGAEFPRYVEGLLRAEAADPPPSSGIVMEAKRAMQARQRESREPDAERLAA
jgi:hypothetical protein